MEGQSGGRYYEPFTTAQAELAKREMCHLLRSLDKSLPVKLDLASVSLLDGSEKSRVFRCTDTAGLRYVIKAHSILRNFEREMQAFDFLPPENVPELKFKDNQRRLFIYRFIEEPYFMSNDSHLRVASFIGKLHDRVETIAADLSGEWQKARVQYVDRYFRHQGGSSDFLMRLKKHFAPNRVLCSIGDLKPDHLFIRDGELVLIDLESFCFFQTEFVDVLGLINFWKSGRIQYDQVLELVSSYLDARTLSRIQPATYIDLLDEFVKFKGFGRGLEDVWPMDGKPGSGCLD